MDESRLQAAEATEQRGINQAIAYGRRLKTYTILVLGREPFTIEAVDAQGRADKMVAAGINPQRDKWAAGYVDDHRALQICGTDGEAKQLLQKYLQNKR